MSDVKVFENALNDLSSLLKHQHVPHMIIGGLANAIWGHPRATLDIDVTVWVQDDQIQKLLLLLKERYVFLVKAPRDFILKTRVLPIKDNENLRIDIIFGALPFEKDALDRAVEVKIGSSPIKFCTAEDLILFKIFSERPKDIEDVRGILRYRKYELDFKYLEPRIEELSNLLERPSIKQQWDQWKEDEAP
jgi:predicted nucleotidyltransferase